MNYSTQMEAARKNIITEQMRIVAQKEHKGRNMREQASQMPRSERSRVYAEN